jgi:deoxynucleoside triphosphate triphosphohydrolase SAMHD1
MESRDNLSYNVTSPVKLVAQRANVPGKIRKSLDLGGEGPPQKRMKPSPSVSGPVKEKIFNDSIHGHVSIHPLCIALVDTPQFQRLRDLLQVGPTYYVFPGASHRRFAHSIGVSYLSGVFVDNLRKNQPGIDISPSDELCVKIAGLCHDLGHGPFSHTYDGKFVKILRGKDPGFSWAHEHASASLLDHLLETNDLMPTFGAYGLGPDDVHFIKELIFGSPADAPKGWEWKGRGAGKDFLYEIVANHRNGIDVDKFDYFARDCKHLGIPTSFDAHRLMRFARVLTGPDGKTQIAYHEKEAWNIYELFHTRYNLHKRAYQHRVAHAVEAMLVDALVAANDVIALTTGGGEVVRMSHAMEHMDVYTDFTDSIFKRIEWEAKTNPALSASKTLLSQVKRRELYSFVGETLLASGKSGDPDDVIMASLLSKCSSDAEKQVFQGVMFVNRVRINYGMGNQNPVDHVLFYLRGDHDTGGYLSKDQVSCFIPEFFQESYVRFYVKSRDPALCKRAKELFRAWSKD